MPTLSTFPNGETHARSAIVSSVALLQVALPSRRLCGGTVVLAAPCLSRK